MSDGVEMLGLAGRQMCRESCLLRGRLTELDSEGVLSENSKRITHMHALKCPLITHAFYIVPDMYTLLYPQPSHLPQPLKQMTCTGSCTQLASPLP